VANEPELNGSASNELSGNSLSSDELPANGPKANQLKANRPEVTEPKSAQDLPTQSNAPAWANPFDSSPRAAGAEQFTGLYRGINAYDAISRAEEEIYASSQASAFAQQPVSLKDSPHPNADLAVGYSPVPSQQKATPLPVAAPAPPKKRLFGLMKPKEGAKPAEAAAGQYIINPLDGSALFVPATPKPKAWWEKQPYDAIAHTLAIGGTVTLAWLFGLLVAQVLPGRFSRPPLQETLLRQSSRIARRIGQLPRLSQTPIAETRIEAIPLPETGPVLAPVSLPPIERQPLIDELNDIETEIITLDRRVRAIEDRLGKPPYQGADVESRLATLRTAVAPPVRAAAEAPTEGDRYEPTPLDPTEQLLEVAKLKIVLPSDALFSPGQSDLKNTPIQDQVLNQVLDQLINYPRATVVIQSYSDNQAKAPLTREYTLAQANTLGNYLQAALPTGYRWVAIGGGQTQPLVSNDQETGRQRNRRIEILVDTRPRS